jgi:23S rRNA (uracil1939-C5)-methyltransferase
MRPLEMTATIASLAPGGDGVAFVEIDNERRAVFVPHSAPGDRVGLEIDPSRRPARGRVLRLESPGADRVEPACAWSTRCGGCDWMHLSVGAQQREHVAHLRAALPAAWRDVAIGSSAAAAPLAYRTRARVHVQCTPRGRVVVGMHEARTREPVEVETCAVLEPSLERARRELAAIFAGSRGGGDVQMALGTKRAAVLDVRWEGELAHDAFGRLEQAVKDGTLAGAQITVGSATRPARIGDPTPWMTGADGQALRLAPGGFGQATESMNATLATHVAETVRPWNVDKAVELFAGAGNLSVLLARETSEIACVESNRDSCAAARENLSARGLTTARVVEADADAYVWGRATRLVVLDPPRTGARAVAERLAASRVWHVVYVSCDSQTLGRDLGILSETYEPVAVTAFEMFPQTSHVEAVVALQRRRP